jgi:hypothetical protein
MRRGRDYTVMRQLHGLMTALNSDREPVAVWPDTHGIVGVSFGPAGIRLVRRSETCRGLASAPSVRKSGQALGLVIWLGFGASRRGGNSIIGREGVVASDRVTFIICEQEAWPLKPRE